MERIKLFFDKIGRWGLFRIMLLMTIIFASLIVFFFFNEEYSVVGFLGILSSIVQVAMFFVWLKSGDISVEHIVEIKEVTAKTREDVVKVKSYVFQETEEHKRIRKLMRKLIEVGAIPEREIYKLLRRNDVFSVYTYGEGVPKRVKEISQGKPPLIGLLEEIGFIRVTFNQNLFVVFSKRLPPNLRDTYALRNFIKKELSRRWGKISKQVREEYPETKYAILEKWRTKTGFKVSFIIMRCPGYDFIIDFLKRTSFQPEFLEKILRSVDWNQLRRLFIKRKHKIKKLLSRISMEILLDEIPGRPRKVILENEEDIVSKLELRDFTDFRLPANYKSLMVLLVELMPNLDESVIEEYAKVISTESQKYYSMLEEFSISFD